MAHLSTWRHLGEVKLSMNPTNIFMFYHVCFWPLSPSHTSGFLFCQSRHCSLQAWKLRVVYLTNVVTLSNMITPRIRFALNCSSTKGSSPAKWISTWKASILSHSLPPYHFHHIFAYKKQIQKWKFGLNPAADKTASKKQLSTLSKSLDWSKLISMPSMLTFSMIMKIKWRVILDCLTIYSTSLFRGYKMIKPNLQTIHQDLGQNLCLH